MAVLENAGVIFIEDDGEHGLACGLQMGRSANPPVSGSTGTATGTAEDGLKAAWDDFEEDADLDALLGEEPGLNPDMAQMWRDDPELWARLSQGGRETLSQSMYGDARAAAAGHFRAETRGTAGEQQ